MKCRNVSKIRSSTRIFAIQEKNEFKKTQIHVFYIKDDDIFYKKIIAVVVSHLYLIFEK